MKANGLRKYFKLIKYSLLATTSLYFVVTNLNLIGLENPIKSYDINAINIISGLSPIIDKNIQNPSESEIKNAKNIFYLPSGEKNIDSFLKNEVIKLPSDNSIIKSKIECKDFIVKNRFEFKGLAVKCYIININAKDIIYKVDDKYYKQNVVVNNIIFSSINFLTINIDKSILNNVKTINYNSEKIISFENMDISTEDKNRILLNYEFQQLKNKVKSDNRKIVQEKCEDIELTLISKYKDTNCIKLSFYAKKIRFKDVDGEIYLVNLETYDIHLNNFQI